jgi:hypothetical protein
MGFIPEGRKEGRQEGREEGRKGGPMMKEERMVKERKG